MKKRLILCGSFFVATVFVGINTTFAQPVLTITPSAVSNTYGGVITLNITGLTNGEKVTVQEWLDLNGNGAIDPGEPMFDSFKITDNNNSNAIIGGVTNINVPVDSNSATGAITTALNFAPPLVFENITGQHLFRVVSSAGAATATLLVTNAVTAQYLTGTIYSNGVPFPNGVMVALPPQGGFAGGTVADATGHYVLHLDPGSYVLTSTMPGFYVDQSTAPLVTLTNGVIATNDFSLTNGPVTITGQVYDAGNSNAIGGLMVQAQSGSLFEIAFTDTNGFYSASVTSNFWKIQPLKERLPRRAYVCPQATFQVDATGGNVTNANIALPRGNALFYGRIADNLGNPFANIELDSSDLNNNYDGKGYSDPNGNYSAVALADGTNVWNCNPDTSANTGLNGYILNNSQTTNIASGQAIRQDYIALPVNAQISGQVRDNSGNPVVGVSLYASTFNGGNGYQSVNSQTDTNGNYSLGVATSTGIWGVNFSYGNDDLASQGLVDLYGPYLVSVPPTNATLNITVYPAGSSALTQPQRFGSQQFGFNVVGSVGVSYTLQVSTNLAAGNWVPLYTFQLTSSPFPVTDMAATNSSRFYRLLKN